MAKKSHGKPQSKPRAKSKSKVTSPAKAVPKTVSVKKAAAPVQTAPHMAAPQRGPNKIMMSPFEFAALVLGIAALVIGIVWLVLDSRAPEPVQNAKNQTIPMTLDDFKGDPALENAIQKQLDNKGGAVPVPSAGPAQINNPLQPTATGLQAQ